MMPSSAGFHSTCFHATSHYLASTASFVSQGAPFTVVCLDKKLNNAAGKEEMDLLNFRSHLQKSEWGSQSPLTTFAIGS